MSDEPDLGALALRAQSLRMDVLDWMNAEEAAGRYPFAFNAPAWPEYQKATAAFAVRVGAEQPSTGKD